MRHFPLPLILDSCREHVSSTELFALLTRKFSSFFCFCFFWGATATREIFKITANKYAALKGTSERKERDGTDERKKDWDVPLGREQRTRQPRSSLTSADPCTARRLSRHAARACECQAPPLVSSPTPGNTPCAAACDPEGTPPQPYWCWCGPGSAPVSRWSPARSVLLKSKQLKSSQFSTLFSHPLLLPLRDA